MNTAESINLPTVLPLWPEGKKPHAIPDEGSLPRLTYYLPSDEFRTGQTVLILPGGGYEMVSTPKEGHRPAQMLASHGIAAAVLEYRHNPQRYPVPLLDAQRALRLLRQKATETDGLNPSQVGAMGFSAGGHLTGMLATQPSHAEGLIGDPLDAVSPCPDFFIMIYAVVSFVNACAHLGSRNNLLGPAHDEALAQQLSIENAVTEKTPPCFIFHGQADGAVPPENALLLYRALTQNHVPTRMHLYEKVEHGIGLGANHPYGQALLDWLKTQFV